MLQWLLFGFMAILLIAGAYMALRTWRVTMQITPEEERYEDRVASLNDRQANRMSDEQLTRPLNAQDSWAAMVGRGRNAVAGRGRRRRASRRRPDA